MPSGVCDHKPQSKETKAKIRILAIGKGNGNWKGDAAKHGFITKGEQS